MIAFQRDEELNVLIHRGKRYNILDAVDMAEFSDAQSKAFGCDQYSHNRIRVLPVSYFHNAAEFEKKRQARIAELAKEDAIAKAKEENRLALLRTAESGEPVETLVEGEETEKEELIELPPYKEWKLDDLKTEATERGLDIANAKKKTDIIALLEADDEADAAGEETEEDEAPSE